MNLSEGEIFQTCQINKAEYFVRNKEKNTEMLHNICAPIWQ